MAHCAHIPAFVLHQVTCQFATGQTLFGPLSVSLEPSLCGLVGRNGVGKTRLLRLLAGLDSPAGGHIERAAAVAWVAQQPTLTPETTLATLLSVVSSFAYNAVAFGLPVIISSFFVQSMLNTIVISLALNLLFAFVGGLLFTLSRANCWDHALLAEAISNANACGAMAVTAKGAMTALPYPDQLNTFLFSRSLAQAMTVK